MSDPLVDENLTPAQTALYRHLQLLTSGQIQTWVNLFAADGVLEFNYSPDGVPRRLQGREELLDYMTHFPETFDVTYTDLVFHDAIDPNVGIAEFKLNGTAIPTGKPYQQTCISVVFTDTAGKISMYHDYWNPLIAIDALTPSAS